MLNKIFSICVSLILLGAMAPIKTPITQSTPISTDITSLIAKYREEIPQHMQEDNIPGLAIAIVDDHSILWIEGFGYTKLDQRIPVTQDTLFSIQSMSKSFTATAAMFAAQDGLVDLGAPITDYLPDFHVNSIFEDHPEQKITLRMLLSHTAGFAHETIYGGNYDHPAYSFEKHIASISDTWLKFPVGTYYSYSNLGIDLAGYILQVRAGIPFIQYVQEKVLQPLGMKDTTLDVKQVRADSTRALGHSDSPFPVPVDFLLIPSGGVWTTAADMARYLQFHINKGAIDGKRLLQEDLAETMYTPPNMAAQFAGYGLGIAVDTRNGARHFQHGGGGFGFNSSMVWYPDLKLGSVVLTNAEVQDSYAYTLSEAVLDDIITSSPEVYTQRTKNTTCVKPAYPQLNAGVPLTNVQLRNLIASKALPENTSSLNRRNTFVGTYVINSFGFPGDTVEVSDTNGELSDTYLGNTAMLTEVKPGLFFTPTGDTLELGASNPLFTNIHLIKINPQTLRFRGVLYAICGLVFLSALLLWPIRALITGVRRKRGKAPATSQATSRPWAASAGGLIALASLFSLVCLVIVAVVPNLVYFPWPHPYPELMLWQFLLLCFPYISLVIAGVAALLAGLALKNHKVQRFISSYFLISILALITFNAVLLV
jgi:CubicO group peptidase (beta-lactamase class C family)